MNEQEKFDDLLRSKLTERDFPFDETNWDKVEELIDRSEKKRRYALIAFIFLAGLGAGIAIMSPFINSNKPSGIVASQQMSQTNTAPIQSKNIVNIGSSNNVNNGVDGNNSPNTAANSQPISSINSNSEGNTQANTMLAYAGNKPKKHIKNRKKLPDTTLQYSYVRPGSEKKLGRKHYNNSLVNNNSNVTSSREPGNSNPVANNNSLESNESLPGSNKLTNQANTHDSNSTDSTNKSQVLTNNSKQVKTDSSATTTHLLNPPSQSKQERYSHTLLSIDVGGGYSFGWKKEGATQGNGFSPIVGISVTHYFSNTISVFVGVQYNSLGNINTLYSNSSTQYNFGENTTVNSVTLKTLYYIALPLKFQYNITDKDIISGGVNILYLLNTSSTVVSYNQDYFGVSGYTSTTKMGYMDGINNLDAQLTLAYRRKINRFTISVEGYYGLLDIENSNFFNNNVFERNSGLRGIISFDIIK